MSPEATIALAVLFPVLFCVVGFIAAWLAYLLFRFTRGH